MPVVGRPRKKNKDLPLGVRLVAGRYYVRPVNESMRQVFARLFPGKKTAPLGSDKAKMREQWVRLFCGPKAEIPKAGTVEEILERFVEDELPRVNPATGRPLYAETTRSSYLGHIRRLKQEFGSRRYARSEAEAASGNFVRTMDVNAYLMRHERSRPYGANQDIVCLASAFRAAKRWGLTEYNPCSGISYIPHSARQQLVSDDAFMKVYEKAVPILQCLMDLGQMCGARRGALAAITLADIRDTGLRVVSNKTKRGQIPKETIYPWTDDLRAVVERAKALRSTRKGSGTVASMHLFLSRRGGPFSKGALDSMWTRAVEAAGIDRETFHFHDIRAKNASAGEDDLEAMKRLAHSDLRTTRKTYRRAPDVVQPLPAVSRRQKP